MIFSKIHLVGFRNFSDRVFSFSPGTTVIVGHNASGKTNILESIYLLSTGKSFKAKVEAEMVGYRVEIARVKGLVLGKETEISESENKFKLEAILTRGEITTGSLEKIQKAPRKKLLLNGVPKRLVDFAGILKVVVFGPQDLDLVTESPSVRRDFLDSVLSQVDREYRRAILSYGKGLRQRNRLLVRIREEGIPRSQLLFWDKLLIKNGDYITRKREEFLEYANNNPTLSGHTFSIRYDKSAISELRLLQYKNEEVAAGTTLVGPHRDDFVFNLKSEERGETKARELAPYGSRGEQRMGVLWLKLIELSYIQIKTNERPVLLLDDIFSELDQEHRKIVMEECGKQQTIITTADPHYVELGKEMEKIQL